MSQPSWGCFVPGMQRTLRHFLIHACGDAPWPLTDQQWADSLTNEVWSFHQTGKSAPTVRPWEARLPVDLPLRTVVTGGPQSCRGDVLAPPCTAARLPRGAFLPSGLHHGTAYTVLSGALTLGSPRPSHSRCPLAGPLLSWA